MTKNVGNYIGFTTDGTGAEQVRLSGVWSVFDQIRYKRKDLWPIRTTNPLTATGGNQTPSSGIAPGNGYRYHIFTSPGNFTVSDIGDAGGLIEVLMVAGGGGAGNPLSAGGGAGGVVYHGAFPTSVTTYPISVGSGGAGSDASTPSSGPAGFRGTPTTAFGMTADGGGGGGPYDGTVPNLPDMSGGSGGGGRTYLPPFTGGTGTQPTFNAPFVPNPQFAQYGTPGASSPGVTDPLGQGGGGAGPWPGSGQNGGPGRPFPGFAAPLIAPVLPAPVQSEIGPTGLYGGGGAGGARNTPALGGPGGGGNSGPGWVGESGFQFTGGGGGGGMYSPSSPTPPAAPPTAPGGSGIVIIRYSTVA